MIYLGTSALTRLIFAEGLLLKHVPRSLKEVIIVGAESTQAEKLAVRDSTYAVISIERSEMEVVVSICSLVVDGGLDLIIRNV